MLFESILTKIRKWLTVDKNKSVSGKYFADAAVIKELNDKFGGMSFGVDSNGRYGYKKINEETIIPFDRDWQLVADVTYKCALQRKDGAYNWFNPWCQRVSRITFKCVNGKVSTTYGTDLGPSLVGIDTASKWDVYLAIISVSVVSFTFN